MNKKLDFQKEYKEYYSAKKNPAFVEFGDIPYLIIEGEGDPDGEVFMEAVGAIYPLAYGIKSICKKKGFDFGVPKLEGLWWVNSDKHMLDVSRSKWCWKLLIRMPDFVTDDMVQNAKESVLKKKGTDLVVGILFEKINEGKCVQIMHVGPYSSEPETIKIMIDFMKINGYVNNGIHHEIYMSDPRKTFEDKMKTVLRQPVKK